MRSSFIPACQLALSIALYLARSKYMESLGGLTTYFSCKGFWIPAHKMTDLKSLWFEYFISSSHLNSLPLIRYVNSTFLSRTVERLIVAALVNKGSSYCYVGADHQNQQYIPTPCQQCQCQQCLLVAPGCDVIMLKLAAHLAASHSSITTRNFTCPRVSQPWCECEVGLG